MAEFIVEVGVAVAEAVVKPVAVAVAVAVVAIAVVVYGVLYVHLGFKLGSASLLSIFTQLKLPCAAQVGQLRNNTGLPPVMQGPLSV